MTGKTALQDGFGRRITYLRVSVTDRCDLRCRYCMAEQMTFLPPANLLSIEELARVCEAFIARGIKKIRLTGGEPLARPGVLDLARHLSPILDRGDLNELTMTTNGSRLGSAAAALADAGLRRINVSLDTLDPERFRSITRWGVLSKTLDGIWAARAAGLMVKINMVVQKGINDTEVAGMLRWCAAQGLDLTLIETMPLGRIEDDRAQRYVPLAKIKDELDRNFAFTPSQEQTGGPARYFNVNGTDIRLGLITPMSHNFCDSCNRMRITADGKLYMCLGDEGHVDLRAACRSDDVQLLDSAVDLALRIKPERHLFTFSPSDASSPVQRHMSVTGG